MQNNMTPIPRMRTIKEAYEWLHQQDPQTGITKNAFRTMAVSGQIPSLKVGSKYLLNVNKMIPFLCQEGNQEMEIKIFGKKRTSQSNFLYVF